jgi:hypothetical protein
MCVLKFFHYFYSNDTTDFFNDCFDFFLHAVVCSSAAVYPVKIIVGQSLESMVPTYFEI